MRKQKPAAAPDPTLEAADAYCRLLTRRHYENFIVASRFVDAQRRRDLARIYAYCRTTDDLGDESPQGTALPRLKRWRAEVEGMFAGEPPVHPVLSAVALTIDRRRINEQPFLDLIAANVQDQFVENYRMWDELIGYCRLSAAPVGRMVLGVFDVTGRRSGAPFRRRLYRAPTRQPRPRCQPRRDARPTLSRGNRRCRKGRCGRRAEHGAARSRTARLGESPRTPRARPAAFTTLLVPQRRVGDLRCHPGDWLPNGASTSQRLGVHENIAGGSSRVAELFPRPSYLNDESPARVTRHSHAEIGAISCRAVQP